MLLDEKTFPMDFCRTAVKDMDAAFSCETIPLRVGVHPFRKCL